MTFRRLSRALAEALPLDARASVADVQIGHQSPQYVFEIHPPFVCINYLHGFSVALSVQAQTRLGLHLNTRLSHLDVLSSVSL